VRSCLKSRLGAMMTTKEPRRDHREAVSAPTALLEEMVDFERLHRECAEER
jgi:hypothetical protein